MCWGFIFLLGEESEYPKDNKKDSVNCKSVTVVGKISLYLPAEQQGNRWGADIRFARAVSQYSEHWDLA